MLRLTTRSRPTLLAATSRRCSVATRQVVARTQQLRIRCMADGGGSDPDSTESLFLRELKRRGISNTAGSAEAPQASGSAAAEGQEQQQQQGGPKPPPRFAADVRPSGPFGGGEGQADDSQLDRSRALNSEGLEGLIPRATELIRLGGGFFLAFGPFIAVISLLFTAAYFALGDSFVHGGTPAYSPPAYVDPYDLLSEPTVDPMIPMGNNIPLDYP